MAVDGFVIFLFGTKTYSQSVSGWVLQQGTFFIKFQTCYFWILVWNMYIIWEYHFIFSIFRPFPMILVCFQVVICLLLRKTAPFLSYIQVSTSIPITNFHVNCKKISCISSFVNSSSQKFLFALSFLYGFLLLCH